MRSKIVDKILKMTPPYIKEKMDTYSKALIENNNINKMKKLIRHKIVEKLKDDEYEIVEDINDLNQLYILKVKEELNEIILADFKDPLEFADLIEVVYAFAKLNGYTKEEIEWGRSQKSVLKGDFSNIVLTNLNPDNPSNNIYKNE